MESPSWALGWRARAVSIRLSQKVRDVAGAPHRQPLRDPLPRHRRAPSQLPRQFHLRPLPFGVSAHQDRLAAVAPAHQVVDGPGELDSQWSGHSNPFTASHLNPDSLSMVRHLSGQLVGASTSPELRGWGAHAAGVLLSGGPPDRTRPANFSSSRWRTETEACRRQREVQRLAAGRRKLHAGRVRSPSNFGSRASRTRRMERLGSAGAGCWTDLA
jgi:hypothetical protein